MSLTNTKEKNNVIKFSLSRDYLLSAFDEAYDMGDLFGALSILNTRRNLFAADADYYEDLIDVCDELGAYGRSVNAWFQYLKLYGNRNLSEKYEGLAASYANLGLDNESVYYYKKMLTSGPLNKFAAEFDEEDFEFIRENASPLRLVYSRNNPDYSGAISEGLELLKKSDFGGAISALSAVKEESPDYIAAANLSAVCHMLKGDAEGGLSICGELLKKYPEDVQTLTTLAAIYAESGDGEKSRQIALELCGLDGVSSDNLYKIATVACENGLDEEALKIFMEIEAESPADKTVLYFIAVAAYRTGRYAVCKKYLKRILTIYPDSMVAAYYMAFAENADGRLKFGEDVAVLDMPYIYHVPEWERKSRVKYLNEALKRSKDFKGLPDSMLTTCIYWAFDEYNGQDSELQLLAVKAAIKCAPDDLIDEIFLRYDVSDAVKLTAIYMILTENKRYDFYVVIANIYCAFRFDGISLGRFQKKLFISSAADVIARYSLFDTANVERIVAATEAVNAAFMSGDHEKKLDEQSLKCAIYLMSGLSGERAWTETVKLFDADEKTVLDLVGAANAVDDEE